MDNKRQASNKGWVLGVGRVTALARAMIFDAKAFSYSACRPMTKVYVYAILILKLLLIKASLK